MWLTIAQFVVGFVFLIKGADILVNGASTIAKKFNISDMVVGLTIVSFGTSAPELVVNIIASMNGNTEIAIGNIFGSNIANILLILGVSAMIYPLAMKKTTVLSEIPFALIAALLVGFLANAALLDGDTVLLISRYDGYILLFFFGLFMVYIYHISKRNPQDTEPVVATMTIKKATIYVVLGVVGLFFGGKWVVEGASMFAEWAGFSQSFIGLTVVAIGTSLPELVTSAMAAYRRNTDIAVGNVIGSNIFNILWILGLSAVIHPLPFTAINNIDLLVIVFASILPILTLGIGKRGAIDRYNGFFFVLTYIVYIVYLVGRQ